MKTWATRTQRFWIDLALETSWKETYALQCSAIDCHIIHQDITGTVKEFRRIFNLNWTAKGMTKQNASNIFYMYVHASSRHVKAPYMISFQVYSSVGEWTWSFKMRAIKQEIMWLCFKWVNSCTVCSAIWNNLSLSTDRAFVAAVHTLWQIWYTFTRIVGCHAQSGSYVSCPEHLALDNVTKRHLDFSTQSSMFPDESQCTGLVRLLRLSYLGIVGL